MQNIILFEDSNRISLRPFTFFRPISQIRIGINTIEEKWQLSLNKPVSNLTEYYLQSKFPLMVSADNVLINSSILPNDILIERIANLEIDTTLQKDDFLIAMRLSAKNLELFSNGENSDLKNEIYTDDLTIIANTWDIVKYNSKCIEEDFFAITSGKESELLSSSNFVFGQNYFIEKGAVVECSSIDTRKGPVYIGKQAHVMPGSHIVGPVSIGENSVIKMGATIYEGTTLGPFCKVGGEISNSILTAFSSKAHDGYLGDSVIGEWCNLGAGTTTSNLNNNYKTVKVWNYKVERFIDTGMQFCGLIMGDHTKTGISTTFNTGTVIGVCCNIYGAGYQKNFIPSFSRGGNSNYQENNLSDTIETAEIVMKRRNRELSEVDKEIFRTVNKITKQYRFC